MVRPKGIIAHIALHGRRHIIRIHHLNLTRDRSIGLREIGAEGRLHQQRILLRAILAVAMNGRGDLWDTQEHRLERAQTKALPLRATDVDITAIVEKVDVLILVARVLRRNHHTVSKHLHGAALPLDFTGKNVEQRESATVTLVRHNQQKQILQRESRHDLHKRNDQKIQALSGDVLVHRRKQEDITRQSQRLTGHITRDGTEHGGIHGMRENVDGACDTLRFDDLLPRLRKAKDAVDIAVQHIDHGGRRRGSRHVHIGPHLEEALLDDLTDLLDIGADHGEIIVDQDDIGSLRQNGGGQFYERKSCLLVFL